MHPAGPLPTPRNQPARIDQPIPIEGGVDRRKVAGLDAGREGLGELPGLLVGRRLPAGRRGKPAAGLLRSLEA